MGVEPNVEVPCNENVNLLWIVGPQHTLLMT